MHRKRLLSSLQSDVALCQTLLLLALDARVMLQTILDALLSRAGMRSALQSTGESNYTLFAPNDIAWAAALYTDSLDCTTDYYVTAPCDSMQDVMTSTNLKHIVSSHGAYAHLSALVYASEGVPEVL